MCFPVRKKRGWSSLALAVWNSSLRRNRHSSSSSSRTTVWRRELRLGQITHRVAPGAEKSKYLSVFSFTLNRQTNRYIYYLCPWSLPFRNWNFLRNPGDTKESQKYRRRPLKSSPVVLKLMEWGLELTKQTVTWERTRINHKKLYLESCWSMQEGHTVAIQQQHHGTFL